MLIEGSRQLPRIWFALVLPDELPSGIDEIGRWPLHDGKHAGPAALVILGELHQRLVLAARTDFALDVAAGCVACSRPKNDDHPQRRAVFNLGDGRGPRTP